MMEYSKKWNKSGKEICSYGMDELVLIVRPQVHSMVVSQLYAPSANVGYVEFNTKFGGVIITEPEGDKDFIYLLDKNSYQMGVAIDYPGNGIFIDTTRYAMSLKNYLFKWLFLFQGMIPF